MLEKLRREVCRWNQELPRNGLVAWTSGNVSARDPKTGLIVIKPSGVVYDELTPENMVVVDPDGKRIEGKLNPSVDTPTHLLHLPAAAGRGRDRAHAFERSPPPSPRSASRSRPA